MIHGKKKEKKVKTAQQTKQEDEVTTKIQSKLKEFFMIVHKPIQPEQLPKYLQFTGVLMQLTSDIPTVLNYRRQLVTLNNDRTTTFEAQLKLTTRLLRYDPKSYTIWSYRQWIVLQLSSPTVYLAEKQLCALMLLKDEKNFHVWNYRNWLNSLHLDVDSQLQFTHEKIKTNPFNFSPYHFRTKLLRTKYSTQLWPLGMPRTVLDEEINTIHTALFLNPSEQAPWLYHTWLIKQLVPAFIILRTPSDQAEVLLFNMKVAAFIPSLSLAKGTIKAEEWEVEKGVTVSSNATPFTEVGLEFGGRYFMGEEVDIQHIAIVKEILAREAAFLREILQDQPQCRFALFGLLTLQQTILHCGLSVGEWEPIERESKEVVGKLLHLKDTKGRKYLERQAKYWQELWEGKQKKQQQILKCFFK